MSPPCVSTQTVVLAHPADLDGWRRASRTLLAEGIEPERIVWQVDGEQADLFADAGPQLAFSGSVAHVPSGFIDLARCVVCHNDLDRFGLLYRVLWRLTHGERDVLGNAADCDVHRLNVFAKAVARDRHKMHAFVRFRQLPGVTPEHYVAWFEPEHHIVRLASGFFRRRFANMGWTILTPELSAHWAQGELVFGPGGGRELLPGEEPTEVLWRTYFASIFNPARLRIDAMRAEMPVKYWKNLPEAPLIAKLIHQAGTRSAGMVTAEPTQPPRYASAAVAAPFSGRTMAAPPAARRSRGSRQ